MVLHVRLTKNSRGLSVNTTACVSFIRYNDSSLIYVPIGSRRSRTFHTHHLRKNPTSLWFLRESNRFCKELLLRYDEEELFLSVCFFAQKKKNHNLLKAHGDKKGNYRICIELFNKSWFCLKFSCVVLRSSLTCSMNLSLEKNGQGFMSEKGAPSRKNFAFQISNSKNVPRISRKCTSSILF